LRRPNLGARKVKSLFAAPPGQWRTCDPAVKMDGKRKCHLELREAPPTLGGMTILDSLRDPALFGTAFAGPTWDAWRVFLAACFGLPMTPAQMEVFRQHTGREQATTSRAREAWVIAGRRAGKSQ